MRDGEDGEPFLRTGVVGSFVLSFASEGREDGEDSDGEDDEDEEEDDDEEDEDEEKVVAVEGGGLVRFGGERRGTESPDFPDRRDLVDPLSDIFLPR